MSEKNCFQLKYTIDTKMRWIDSRIDRYLVKCDSRIDRYLVKCDSPIDTCIDK